MTEKGPVSAHDIITAKVAVAFVPDEIISEWDPKVDAFLKEMVASIRKTHFEDCQIVTGIIWDAPKEGVPLTPDAQITNIVWDVFNEIREVEECSGIGCLVEDTINQFRKKHKGEPS
jgi:hypothetical protein